MIRTTKYRVMACLAHWHVLLSLVSLAGLTLVEQNLVEFHFGAIRTLVEHDFGRTGLW
jgi:hypothetical protein